MNKKNLILGGILIALIGIAYLYNGPLKDWRADLRKPSNFLAKLNVEQVSKIEITREGEATVLEKVGDKWKIGGTKEFYVQEHLFGDIIRQLTDAVKAEVELVSENKNKKAEFQTDEATGIMVRLSQAEQELAAFVVGKMASDFSSTYISQIDSNKTYVVKAGLSSAFGAPDWYDRTIFSADKENINKIRFQYPAREFTVEKSALVDDEAADDEEVEKWAGTLPYSFKVDREKLDKILNIMANLSAVKIPEQDFTVTGLEKNNIIIQATGEGADNVLMIGDAYIEPAEVDEEIRYYYAKKGNSDNIYLITKEQRDELNKQIWELQ